MVCGSADIRYPAGKLEDTEFTEINSLVDVDKGKMINVNQAVLSKQNKKKGIYLTKVSIFGENQQLIGTAKTNVQGNWKLDIPPGKYKITYTKPATPQHSEINISQEIEISDNKKIIQLPDMIC